MIYQEKAKAESSIKNLRPLLCEVSDSMREYLYHMAIKLDKFSVQRYSMPTVGGIISGEMVSQPTSVQYLNVVLFGQMINTFV